jgi:pyridoxine 5-phosphate synthase|tara:strand:+ start:383 stop:1120 length:738 start_codon:yes stop_codon:yes gene_type:complete
MRFYVNVDHVATVRQARGTDEPDPVRAAVLVELAGANGITVHLREDRRHVNERDVRILMETVRTGVNLEIASEKKVLDIACEIQPMQVTLVPEKRQELTTEGGLALGDKVVRSNIGRAIGRLSSSGIRTALFIDPDEVAVSISSDLGADAVELHTGEYANANSLEIVERQLARLTDAAKLASEKEMGVHAGHGLTYENVSPVAMIPFLEELNIGHSIISRAILVGLDRAVKEMKMLISPSCDRYL